MKTHTSTTRSIFKLSGSFEPFQTETKEIIQAIEKNYRPTAVTPWVGCKMSTTLGSCQLLVKELKRLQGIS